MSFLGFLGFALCLVFYYIDKVGHEYFLEVPESKCLLKSLIKKRLDRGRVQLDWFICNGTTLFTSIGYDLYDFVFLVLIAIVDLEEEEEEDRDEDDQ